MKVDAHFLPFKICIRKKKCVFYLREVNKQMSSTKKHFKAFSTLIITIETQEEIGNIIEIDETNKELYNYY
jgi:hypothetical protein